MWQSLRDARAAFWDGERIDDLAAHPRFKNPMVNTGTGYACDELALHARHRGRVTDGAECGRRALDESEFQCSVKR